MYKELFALVGASTQLRGIAVALLAAVGCSSPAAAPAGSAPGAGGGPGNGSGDAGDAAGGGSQSDGGGPPVNTSSCAPTNVAWGLPQNLVIHAGTYFKNMTAADLNRDGKSDIVVLEADGLEVFLSNGDGTFKPGKYYAQPSGLGYAITAGDFHGTGNWDVLASTSDPADGNSPVAGLFSGNGDGTLSSVPTFVPIGTTYMLKGIAADMNADHKVDFVFDNYQFDYNPGVVLNRGGANLGGPLPLAIASGWTVGDLNGDGAADIVETPPNRTYTGTCVLMNTGSGQFAAAPTCYAGPTSNGLMKVAVGDINGDNKLDAVGVDDGSGGVVDNNIAAYLGKGDGKLNDRVISSLKKDMLGIALADVNNDGKADFVAFVDGSEASSLVEILLSNGDGSFAAPIEMALGRFQSGMEQNPLIADFAGNGLKGIAVQRSNSTDTNLGIDVVVATCKK